jgi:hypothetical protein
MKKKSDKEMGITADVVLDTPSGVTILDVKGTITAANVKQYQPSNSTIKNASEILEDQGFRILSVTKTGLIISGTKELFESVFSITLQMTNKSFQGEFYKTDSAPEIPEILSPYVKAIIFPEPPTFFS